MRRSVIVAVTAVVALVVATAPPALAAPEPPPNDNTVTTFTLTGGALYVSAPVSADLGSGIADNNNGGFSGPLGNVFVIDDRAALNATWNATVTGTNFTTGGGTPAETIPAPELMYSSGPLVDSNGNAVFQPGPTVGLIPGGIVMSASSGNGSNAAEWNPTITLHPTNTRVAGTYQGVISHSVS